MRKLGGALFQNALQAHMTGDQKMIYRCVSFPLPFFVLVLFVAEIPAGKVLMSEFDKLPFVGSKAKAIHLLLTKLNRLKRVSAMISGERVYAFV